MVVLNIQIELKGKTLNLIINKLKREDAIPYENKIAKAVEELVKTIFVDILKQGGHKVSWKNLPKKPKPNG